MASVRSFDGLLTPHARCAADGAHEVLPHRQLVLLVVHVELVPTAAVVAHWLNLVVTTRPSPAGNGRVVTRMVSGSKTGAWRAG
jgi:hypothetical protein